MDQAFKWYIVHVYSGFENKVVSDVLENAKRKKLDQFIKEFYVPKETVTKIIRGKRVDREKSSFPGYLLVCCQLNDHLFSLIKNTNRVTNFLCAGGKPVIIPEKEVEEIKRMSEVRHIEGQKEDSFNINDIVKINEGAFLGFTGVIKHIDNTSLKIEVTIFGRPVMVDLNIAQIEKTGTEN